MSELRIFDTHVHYNLDPLWPNWPEHWQAAQAHGVDTSLVVGTTLATSQAAVGIATQDPHLFAAVGVHPYELRIAVENKLDIPTFLTEVSTELSAMLKADSSHLIRAIGETGLDYFRQPSDQAMVEAVCTAQRQSLELQLQLALQHQLPLILHVRDSAIPETQTPGNAYWDTLELIQKYQPNAFILHCASGPRSYVQAMVELGAHVSFAGNVTYPSADSLRALIPLVPANKILLETDAPFLPPQGFRGKPCEPLMIAKTAEFLAENCGINLEQTYRNAEELFIRYNNST
jgi:TatD DNase family protein